MHAPSRTSNRPNPSPPPQTTSTATRIGLIRVIAGLIRNPEGRCWAAVILDLIQNPRNRSKNRFCKLGVAKCCGFVFCLVVKYFLNYIESAADTARQELKLMYNNQLTDSSSQHATSPRRYSRLYKRGGGGAHAPALRGTRNCASHSALSSRAC